MAVKQHSNVMSKLPALLVASRFILGPFICVLSKSSAHPIWVLGLLLAAMLSDIFDGVIARRLGVATERLRVMDSRADAWFFVWIGLAAWLTVPGILRAYAVPLCLEVAIQLASYAFDLTLYGRIASLHAYTAKVWGFSLYIAAAGLLAFHLGWPIWLAFGLGILSAVDAMAIKIMLPEWKHDVLSFFHACRIREDKRASDG